MYIFLEDEDLLDIVNIESALNQNYIIEDEETKEEQNIKDIIQKTILLFNRELLNPKFKMFRGKIKLNPKLYEEDYSKFITYHSKHLILGRYDIENIRYNGDNKDELHNIPDLFKEIENRVNEKIRKYNYYLDIEKDEDGEGDIILYRR